MFRKVLPHNAISRMTKPVRGTPRGTVAMDCVIAHSEADFIRCEEALNSFGLESRLPVRAKEVFHFRQEYIEKRNRIAWSFVNPCNPMGCVDIINTHNLQLLQTQYFKFGLSKVPVLAIDGLIAMKRLSGRPQDIKDIKSLELIRERKKKNS